MIKGKVNGLSPETTDHSKAEKKTAADFVDRGRGM
jgi:hypothetical protein